MEQQKQDLENWVHSLDRETTNLVRSNASLRATVEHHSTQLDHISDNIDRLLDQNATPKPPINLIAGIAAIATIVVCFGVFVELRLAPAEQVEALMFDTLSSHLEVSEQAHTELARLAAKSEIDREHLHELFKHMRERDHSLDARVIAVETAASEGFARIDGLRYSVDTMTQSIIEHNNSNRHLDD